jgi:hypothetical protein
MAERRHVVVKVEIGPPVGIVEPHAFATNEVHGLAVLESIRGPKDCVTAGNQFGFALGKSDLAGCVTVWHKIFGHKLLPIWTSNLGR